MAIMKECLMESNYIETMLKNIRTEQIAGHEAAIAKLTESIGDRITDIGNPVINKLVNQDIAMMRILIKELREMKQLEVA